MSSMQKSFSLQRIFKQHLHESNTFAFSIMITAALVKWELVIDFVKNEALIQ